MCLVRKHLPPGGGPHLQSEGLGHQVGYPERAGPVLRLPSFPEKIRAVCVGSYGYQKNRVGDCARTRRIAPPKKRMRKGDSLPTCKCGHDIGVLGRTKAGNCKACTRTYEAKRRATEYRQAHIVRYRWLCKASGWRTQNLRTKGGAPFTVVEYEKLAADQGSKCALCHIPQAEYRRAFDVDHCHTTGVVRGLLCNTCNQHLGTYEKMRRLGAEEYIKCL